MSDKLRDNRRNKFYIIDNDFLDRFGSELGPYGIAAYNAIARFANAEGENSFPSYPKIADLTGMSRTAAINAVNKLVDMGLIEREQRRTANGQASNLYTLIDTTEVSTPHVLPSTPHVPTPVHHTYPPSTPHVPDQDTLINTPIEQDIESASHRTPAPPSTKKAQNIDPFFELMCKITGIDYKTISAERRGQLNQARGILLAAGYTSEDLTKFWNDVWVKDWRYKKNKSKPTIQQLRDEIGKLRTTNVIPSTESHDNLPEYDAQVWDTSRIDF